MGNVGNIEKVMVFGILAIIICILCIAVWGHNAVSEPPSYIGDPSTAFASGAGDNLQPLNAQVPLPITTPEPEVLSPAPVVPEPELLDAPSGNDVGDQKLPGETPRDLSVHSEVDPDQGTAAVTTAQRTYRIQKGDNFEVIAVNILGDRSLVDELLKANEDVDPRKLQIGQLINLPSVLPRANLESAMDVQAPRESPPATTYKVRDGDSLFKIARSQLGSSLHWEKLWKANLDLIPDKNDLRPGMTLTLP